MSVETRSEKSCCGPSCCAPEADVKHPDVREIVREKYGKAVTAVLGGAKPSCCGSAVDLAAIDPITRGHYLGEDAAALPEDALRASFGCGNPTALAELRAGETVLDLGSGGGIDVLLSARRVGPTGLAYGVDMTDEMLALANANKKTAGATNVIFLRGTIEEVPLPDASVDVVISNCVINLAADKDRVLREAFRVLRPGGRFAVSDIVLKKALPARARASMELWTGCVAGALVEADYADKLRAAGFGDVGIEPTRVYDRDALRDMAASVSPASRDEAEAMLGDLDGAVMSAFVRATKPQPA